MPSSSAESHRTGSRLSRSGWRYGWLLVGLVLLEGIAHYGFLSLTQPDRTIEKFEYEQIAQHLLRGEGYRYDLGPTTYRSYGPPLYPAICASFYFLFGESHGIIVLFQLLCRIALGLIVWKIAQRIVSPLAAKGAGLWAALHPGIAHCSLAKLHPLPMDALLIAASILLFLRAGERPSLGRGFAAGIALGLAAHTRETSLVLLPVGLLWFLWKGRWKAAPSRGCAIAIGLTLAATLAPWTIRNVFVHDRWIFMRTDAGWNWWLGNHPGSSGSSLTPSGSQAIDEAPQAREWLGLPELGQMDRFLEQGKRYIQARPWDALVGWGKRLFYFWWFSPQTGLLYPSGWRVIYQWYYGVFLILCAVGLYPLSVKPFSGAWRPLSLILLASVAISVAQSLFYVEGRHRWPVEVLLIPLAAEGVCRIIRWGSRPQVSRS